MLDFLFGKKKDIEKKDAVLKCIYSKLKKKIQL